MDACEMTYAELERSPPACPPKNGSLKFVPSTLMEVLIPRLPANVRVLCSAATGPQRAPRVLTAFGERDFVAVPMEPLTRDERRAVVKAVPRYQPSAPARDRSAVPEVRQVPRSDLPRVVRPGLPRAVAGPQAVPAPRSKLHAP